MGTTIGTTIYTTDSDWINTPVPYEVIKDQLLTERGQYIEVPGAQGNSYMIKVSNITCIEQELPNNGEEKK